jgi:hypothetical protein
MAIPKKSSFFLLVMVSSCWFDLVGSRQAWLLGSLSRVTRDKPVDSSGSVDHKQLHDTRNDHALIMRLKGGYRGSAFVRGRGTHFESGVHRGHQGRGGNGRMQDGLGSRQYPESVLVLRDELEDATHNLSLQSPSISYQHTMTRSKSEDGHRLGTRFAYRSGTNTRNDAANSLKLQGTSNSTSNFPAEVHVIAVSLSELNQDTHTHTHTEWLPHAFMTYNSYKDLPYV